MDIDMIKGSDLIPDSVNWYWRGWLAAGKMHILAGSPGTGKTTIAMSLAATITRGGEWPDGTEAPVGDVVIWSGEDSPNDTLLPRLLASGADVNRIHFMVGVGTGKEKRPFNPTLDMPLLIKHISEIKNVKLLIIDPIGLIMKGDSHKNTEVRNSLQPLIDLATDTGCSLLGITHLTKGTTGHDPLERVTGSLAFGAVPRVVMLATKTNDIDTPRILLRAKSNLGQDDGGFGYDLEEKTLEEYPDITASTICWGVPIQGQAREILDMTESNLKNNIPKQVYIQKNRGSIGLLKGLFCLFMFLGKVLK